MCLLTEGAGGLMGLFIGASVISVIEIGEFLLMALLRKILPKKNLYVSSNHQSKFIVQDFAIQDLGVQELGVQDLEQARKGSNQSTDPQAIEPPSKPSSRQSISKVNRINSQLLTVTKEAPNNDTISEPTEGANNIV